MPTHVCHKAMEYDRIQFLKDIIETNCLLKFCSSAYLYFPDKLVIVKRVDHRNEDC